MAKQGVPCNFSSDHSSEVALKHIQEEIVQPCCFGMTSVHNDVTKADFCGSLTDNHWPPINICFWYELELHIAVFKMDLSIPAAADFWKMVFVVVEVAINSCSETNYDECDPPLLIRSDPCCCCADVQRFQHDTGEVELDGSNDWDIPAAGGVWEVKLVKLILDNF